MNRKLASSFIVFAACAALRAQAGALVYDEATERVTLGEGGQQVVFLWNAKANGFVTERGDWIAWDSGANGWLMVPKSGPRARFDAAGNFVGREEPPPVAAVKPTAVKPAAVGYDPTADAGDSGGNAQADTKAAFDYLHKRDTALAANATNSVAGDSGGGAILAEALGGDAAGRRKQERENFKMRPGAHANDPDSVLETGAVKDPLQSLMESMQSLSDMASGVQGTIQGVDDLGKQIRHFGDGKYSGPPAGTRPTPSDGNNPLPPANGGAGGVQQPVPPGGNQQPGFAQPGLGQQPGYGGYQIPGYGGFGGGSGGGGAPAAIGGKPPGQPQQAGPGSAIIPQGAIPQGGVQGLPQQAVQGGAGK